MKIRCGYGEISVDEARRLDPFHHIHGLKTAAENVLAVISQWKLEGATHISPRSQAALSAGNRLLVAHDALDQRVRHSPTVEQERSEVLALFGLEAEQLEHARCAFDLLRSAVRSMPSDSKLDREGITCVDPSVCQKLRHAVEILDRQFGESWSKFRPVGATVEPRDRDPKARLPDMTVVEARADLQDPPKLDMTTVDPEVLDRLRGAIDSAGRKANPKRVRTTLKAGDGKALNEQVFYAGLRILEALGEYSGFERQKRNTH